MRPYNIPVSVCKALGGTTVAFIAKALSISF